MLPSRRDARKQLATSWDSTRWSNCTRLTTCTQTHPGLRNTLLVICSYDIQKLGVDNSNICLVSSSCVYSLVINHQLWEKRLFHICFGLQVCMIQLQLSGQECCENAASVRILICVCGLHWWSYLNRIMFNWSLTITHVTISCENGRHIYQCSLIVFHFEKLSFLRISSIFVITWSLKLFLNEKEQHSWKVRLRQIYFVLSVTNLSDKSLVPE